MLAFSGQPKKSTDLCYINSAGWVEYQIIKNFIHPWKKTELSRLVLNRRLPLIVVCCCCTLRLLALGQKKSEKHFIY